MREHKVQFQTPKGTFLMDVTHYDKMAVGLRNNGIKRPKKGSVTGPDPGLLTLVCSIGQLTDEPLKPGISHRNHWEIWEGPVTMGTIYFIPK